MVIILKHWKLSFRILSSSLYFCLYFRMVGDADLLVLFLLFNRPQSHNDQCKGRTVTTDCVIFDLVYIVYFENLRALAHHIWILISRPKFFPIKFGEPSVVMLIRLLQGSFIFSMTADIWSYKSSPCVFQRPHCQKLLRHFKSIIKLIFLQ